MYKEQNYNIDFFLNFSITYHSHRITNCSRKTWISEQNKHVLYVTKKHEVFFVEWVKTELRLELA